MSSNPAGSQPRKSVADAKKGATFKNVLESPLDARADPVVDQDAREVLAVLRNVFAPVLTLKVNARKRAKRKPQSTQQQPNTLNSLSLDELETKEEKAGAVLLRHVAVGVNEVTRKIENAIHDHDLGEILLFVEANTEPRTLTSHLVSMTMLMTKIRICVLEGFSMTMAPVFGARRIAALAVLGTARESKVFAEADLDALARYCTRPTSTWIRPLRFGPKQIPSMPQRLSVPTNLPSHYPDMPGQRLSPSEQQDLSVRRGSFEQYYVPEEYMPAAPVMYRKVESTKGGSTGRATNRDVPLVGLTGSQASTQQPQHAGSHQQQQQEQQQYYHPYQDAQASQKLPSDQPPPDDQKRFRGRGGL
eukprot:Clim_evm17s70 gene=Clim_evmTU17s70